MLSQKRIAERVGCTQGAVSRWFAGETKPHPMFAKILQEQFPKAYQKMVEAYEREHEGRDENRAKRQ